MEICVASLRVLIEPHRLIARQGVPLPERLPLLWAAQACLDAAETELLDSELSGANPDFGESGLTDVVKYDNVVSEL